jgi:hypothetical protein
LAIPDLCLNAFSPFFRVAALNQMAVSNQAIILDEQKPRASPEETRKPSTSFVIFPVMRVVSFL